MSSEYCLSEQLSLLESSDTVSFWIDNGTNMRGTGQFTEEQFRALIIRQIEVLSYISTDPDEVLKRFNVNYGDKS